MKTRSKIQLLVVLSVIFGKCWSLQQQFSGDGALAVILFGAIALSATVALLRRQSGFAFVVAMGSTFLAFSLARDYCFAPTHTFASMVYFIRDEVLMLGLAGCLFSLWAEWRIAEAKLVGEKA